MEIFTFVHSKVTGYRCIGGKSTSWPTSTLINKTNDGKNIEGADVVDQVQGSALKSTLNATLSDQVVLSDTPVADEDQLKI